MLLIPGGESAEPAFERRKNEKHFTPYYHVQSFAYRQTQDKHTKQIRIISMIYSPTRDHAEKTKRTNNHHIHVFLNTNQRDLHPCASPVGLGTTPSAKCQRWFAVRPPGAAMRLTASRQPYDITRPKYSRHAKPMPDLQNNYPPRSFATANPPPQIQKNAEEQDRTARRTAAQQRLPIIWHALAHCLNRIPSTLAPAKLPLFLIQRLIISTPESCCPLKPIA